MARSVHVRSFGCRASQADGEALEHVLGGQGFRLISNAANSDIAVINTCTVTRAADADARRAIRDLHRDSPHTHILVTGCYAQRAPEELIGLGGVTWVVGNSHKTHIPSLLHAEREEWHGGVFRGGFDAFSSSPAGTVHSGRTRPNLKVQDGCGNRCSFCIIPSVRGPSRSATLDDVVSQMKPLAARFAEVVLTGINLGRWGRDLPGRPRFSQLLQTMLDNSAVQRLRVSSVEPMDWSDELIELFASEPRLARHVHMPLQSGSDAVLKRMRRRYRIRHYRDRLLRAYQALPDAAFGADVITGFPGETDEDFKQTVQVIEEMPFTYLHVFTYSERPGTDAATLPEAVPVALRRERTHALRELSTRKNLVFRQKMIGRKLSAVTLEERGIALSSNYLRIITTAQHRSNELRDFIAGEPCETGIREWSPFPILSA